MRNLPVWARVYVVAIIGVAAVDPGCLRHAARPRRDPRLRRPHRRHDPGSGVQAADADHTEPGDDIGLVRHRLRVAADSWPSQDDAGREHRRHQPIALPHHAAQPDPSGSRQRRIAGHHCRSGRGRLRVDRRRIRSARLARRGADRGCRGHVLFREQRHGRARHRIGDAETDGPRVGGGVPMGQSDLLRRGRRVGHHRRDRRDAHVGLPSTRGGSGLCGLPRRQNVCGPRRGRTSTP